MNQQRFRFLPPRISRRRFLRHAGEVWALGSLGCFDAKTNVSNNAGAFERSSLPEPFSHGEFLQWLPFVSEAPYALGERTGSGSDGRLSLDLRKAEPPTTPNESFFIHTFAPGDFSTKTPWTLQLRGLAREPVEMGKEQIVSRAKPMGPVYLDCVKNDHGFHFGLMSIAEWKGVPFSTVREMAEISPQATQVLISGSADDAAHASEGQSTVAWVFTLEQLENAGAFLATHMNGEPLPVDHGFPVRLIVPGWYGCAAIKWVNEIKFVDDQEPATAQMREFSKQKGHSKSPTLAREFEPALVERSAVVTRVEKWMIDGSPTYRIIGITWGRSEPSATLTIRCNNSEDFRPVDSVPSLESSREWTYWTHLWKPTAAGNQRISLDVINAESQSTRLDGRMVKIP